MVELPSDKELQSMGERDTTSCSEESDTYREKSIGHIYWWEVVDHDHGVVMTQITEPHPELEEQNVTVRIGSCIPQPN